MSAPRTKRRSPLRHAPHVFFGRKVIAAGSSEIYFACGCIARTANYPSHVCRTHRPRANYDIVADSDRMRCAEDAWP